MGICRLLSGWARGWGNWGAEVGWDASTIGGSGGALNPADPSLQPRFGSFQLGRMKWQV